MRRALAFLLLTGCAVVRPVAAPSGDLSDYRAFALAKTEGQRLALATAYLEHHPNGAWAADVRASFQREEPDYYQACTRTRSRAIDYLAWLPQGPHAEAALATVHAFDEHVPDTEAARMLRDARANEARLEQQAQERSAANQTLLAALSLAIDANVYGRPLGASEPLARWISAGRNWGVTPGRRAVGLPFTVPTSSGPEPRSLDFVLTATLDGVTVVAIEISGPHMFERWAETSLLRPLGADAATRAEALRFAQDAVTTLLKGRQASGATLEALTVQGDDEDRILVRLAPPNSSTARGGRDPARTTGQ